MQDAIKRICNTEDGRLVFRALHDECMWANLSLPDNDDNARVMVAMRLIYQRFRLLFPIDRLMEIEHNMSITTDTKNKDKDGRASRTSRK